MRLGRFIVPQLILLAFIVFAAVELTQSYRPVTAAGATLGAPAATCSGGTTATVSFSWSAVVASEQWVDLSSASDNFAPGMFAGRPVASGASTYTWQGVPAGTPQLWRVTTLTSDGWLVSETGAFVACGGPALLWASVTCDGPFFARAEFRWAPSVPGVALQYLDVGADPGFAPASFSGAGPLAASTHTYTWSGLQANTWTYYRVNALGEDGVWRTTETGSFRADCAPPFHSDLYGSNDRLVIAGLGVDAPVNVRDVGFDGVLGNPAGPLDVVRYSFPLYEGVGGYPGRIGTTMIAGHLDFRNYGLAVFAPLLDIGVGERVDYYRGDGVVVSYVVDWVADVSPNYPFGELTLSTGVDALVLITCNGEFNYDAGAYSHRRVVHAVRFQ